MRPSYRRIQQQRVENPGYYIYGAVVGLLGVDRLVFLGKGLWYGEAQDFGKVMGCVRGK
jgi:hypothetical protein